MKKFLNFRSYRLYGFQWADKSVFTGFNEPIRLTSGDAIRPTYAHACLCWFVPIDAYLCFLCFFVVLNSAILRKVELVHLSETVWWGVVVSIFEIESFGFQNYWWSLVFIFSRPQKISGTKKHKKAQKSTIKRKTAWLSTIMQQNKQFSEQKSTDKHKSAGLRAIICSPAALFPTDSESFQHSCFQQDYCL